MAKRDILNYEGTKIGELEEPSGVTWTEEEWTERLSKFAVAPATPQDQMIQMLSRQVSESRKIADEIIEAFKLRNLKFFIDNEIPNDLAIMMSLHVHHRLRAVEITVGGVAFTIDLLNLVISGDLETAYVVLKYMQPDSMEQPYHFWSQEVIDLLRTSIADRIGIMA